MNDNVASPAKEEPTDVATADQFLREISDRRNWPAGMRPDFWFRGHANANWELQPALLRSSFADKARASMAPRADFDNHLAAVEESINQEFRRTAAHLIDPAATTLVDIYFQSQHHGLPTRLLDWSTNALAALFFSVSETDQNEIDGMIYAICPNIQIHGRDVTVQRGAPKGPVYVRHPIVQDEIARLFGENSSVNETPFVLPVLPDSRAGRMLQQGSCFTLHVRGSQPISSASYRRYRIPMASKERIQSDLRIAGISWATLFPDLDHVALEIRTLRGFGP